SDCGAASEGPDSSNGSARSRTLSFMPRVYDGLWTRGLKTPGSYDGWRPGLETRLDPRRRTVGVGEIALRFVRGRNEFAARLRENLLRLVGPLFVVRVDREQDSALADPAFVTLGFVLGQAVADECAGDATERPSRACARQRGHNRSRRDEWSDARNRERSDAGEPAECPADEGASAGARGRAFRRFGVELVPEVLRSLVLRPEDRDVRCAEAQIAKGVDGSFHLVLRRVDCKHRGIRHG